MSEENNYKVLMARVHILLVLAVLNIVVAVINIFFNDSYLFGAIGIFVFCVCMWMALSINKRAQQSVHPTKGGQS
jgi:hypothetical protein